MSKGLKIFAGVMVFLGVVSLVFLLVAKKKSQGVIIKKQVSQIKQGTAPVKKIPVKKQTNSQAQQTTKTQPTVKISTSDQWQQCKNKTMASDKSLFWNVQITDGMPAGGIYAKGLLNGNSAYPVHVTIKSGIQNADKITQMLASGKTVTLRGNCVDLTFDGAVVFQAF